MPLVAGRLVGGSAATGYRLLDHRPVIRGACDRRLDCETRLLPRQGLRRCRSCRQRRQQESKSACGDFPVAHASDDARRWRAPQEAARAIFMQMPNPFPSASMRAAIVVALALLHLSKAD